MKPSEELFALIKSFSAAEIRHFRQGAKRYGPDSEEKKYVQLFDTIHAQQSYDEAAVKGKLADVIPLSSFASWKRHLRAYLESSLREFYAGRESEEKIHEGLRDAVLLSRRGLWQQGIAKLQDCKRLALALDHTITLLKVNEVERRILIEFGRTNIAARMQELLDEAAAWINQLRQEQETSEIFEKTCLLIRLKFDSKDQSVASQVPELLNDPRLQADQPPKGFKARRQYHQARAFLFHLSERPEEEYQEYLALLSHWDGHEIQKRVDTITYKHSLTNLLHSAYKLHRWEHLPEVTQAMKAYPAQNMDEEAEDFQTLEFYRLLYKLDCGEVGQALDLISEIETRLKRYDEKINRARWLSFKVNMAVTYFVADDFSNANAQIQEIFRSPRTDHRPDAYALARLLDPFIAFELQEEDYAEHRLHALKEWLRSHSRLREFEKQVMTHLDNLFHTAENMRKQVFSTMAQEMAQYVAMPVPPQGAELFHLWAQARTQGSKLRPYFEANSQSRHPE